MKIVVIGSIVGIILIAAAGYVYFGGTRSSEIRVEDKIETLAGRVDFVDLGANAISIQTDAGDKNLAIVPETKFFDDNNNPVTASFFQSGFEIEARGTKTGDNTLNAAEIKAIKLPSIIVSAPGTGEAVSDTLVVRGKARVFENQFNLRISSGEKSIYETTLTSNALDAGLFGDFEKTIDLNSLNLGSGDLMLEVFDKSAKDGSEIDKVSIPLKYQPGNLIGVRIYFNNSKFDPKASCDKVFPVERGIKKTLAVGRATLEELLKGPTEEEKSQGYLTNINAGVKVQSLAIIDGVARVDFDQKLQDKVAGSCRVTAIRAQITQTLKQLPGVQGVLISINGNSTSTLQP